MFGKFITIFLLLAFSDACLMVDTTSLGCFSITTEIIYSETGGNKYQADVFWYICASDQLVSTSSLPVKKYNKQSHYTTVQGLPLHWCDVFHFSILHDLGLLLTFQNTLPLLQRMRDLLSNLFFSFTVHFLFAEEDCNHGASWFLFLFLHNYTCFNLPLKFMFPWPWIMLSGLYQTFFNHSTYFWIQRLKFRLRSFSCLSLSFICLPSWQILGQEIFFLVVGTQNISMRICSLTGIYVYVYMYIITFCLIERNYFIFDFALAQIFSPSVQCILHNITIKWP